MKKLYSSFEQNTLTLYFKDQALESEFKKFSHKRIAQFMFFYTLMILLITVLGSVLIIVGLVRNGVKKALVIDMIVILLVSTLYFLWYRLTKRF